MPKRILDGESLWRSSKLAAVNPPSIRAEFANLIPLAMANGSFECDSRLVWSRVYAFNRPDVSVDDVAQILAEFERVRLLFRWNDPSGKQWGYWVGIDKPGRLPGKSRRGRNEAVGADPPQDQLRKFMESIGFHTEQNGNGKLLGFGSGLGLGSGEIHSSESKDDSDVALSASAKVVQDSNTLRKRPEPSPIATRLESLLRTAIMATKPDAKLPRSEGGPWAVTIDRMLRNDKGRTPDAIEAVLRYLPSSEFWSRNILSADNLRRNFDRVQLEMTSSAKRSKSPAAVFPANHRDGLTQTEGWYSL